MISYKEAFGHYNMNIVTLSKVLLKYYKFDDGNHLMEYIEKLMKLREDLPPDVPSEAAVGIYFTRYWREVLEHLESLGLKTDDKDKITLKLTT